MKNKNANIDCPIYNIGDNVRMLPPYLYLGQGAYKIVEIRDRRSDFSYDDDLYIYSPNVGNYNFIIDVDGQMHDVWYGAVRKVATIPKYFEEK